MAKVVWLAKEDLKAFQDGKEVAQQGKPRRALIRYSTYNERAAFNDGWDSVSVLRPKARAGQQKNLAR